MHKSVRTKVIYVKKLKKVFKWFKSDVYVPRDAFKLWRPSPSRVPLYLRLSRRPALVQRGSPDRLLEYEIMEFHTNLTYYLLLSREIVFSKNKQKFEAR